MPAKYNRTEKMFYYIIYTFVFLLFYEWSGKEKKYKSSKKINRKKMCHKFWDGANAKKTRQKKN